MSEKGSEVYPQRAIEALERAALASTGGSPRPLPSEEDRATSDDYAALDAAQARHAIGRVILGVEPNRGLDQLEREGGLEALLPEVAAMVGFGEGGRHHKDVWDHTKRVVAQSPTRELVRWAALLHDVGKIPTRRTAPDGQVTFHGHAEVGARMIRKVLVRFGFDHDKGKYIRRLVLFHLRPSQYLPSWTDSAVRRFGKEVGDVLDDLLDLSRADMTTKYVEKRRRGHGLIDELSERVATIREIDAREPLLPKGLGSAIMEHFSLPPGPRIGVLRQAVEAAVESDVLEPRLDSQVYLDWLEEHLDELPS